MELAANRFVLSPLDKTEEHDSIRVIGEIETGLSPSVGCDGLNYRREK